MYTEYSAWSQTYFIEICVTASYSSQILYYRHREFEFGEVRATIATVCDIVHRGL